MSCCALLVDKLSYLSFVVSGVLELWNAEDFGLPAGRVF